jgi:predicted anti-sigma-YlaC factor YlaD
MTRLLQRLRRLPPDCREVAAVLQSYLDGELPASEVDRVAEHLEHCERCGIERDVYDRVKRSLGALATRPDRDAVARLRSFAEAIPEDLTE